MEMQSVVEVNDLMGIEYEDSEGEWFGRLPDEVLGYIFELLGFSGKIARVSKRWNRVYENFFRLDYKHCKSLAHEIYFTRCDASTILETLEARYQKRIQVFSDGEAAMKILEIATDLGREVLVDRLLEDKRVNPAFNDNQPLRLAAKKGHASIVKRLMEDPRVDPADCNDYAFLWAVTNRQHSVVALLLKDNRVNPAVHSNYAIREAAESGDVELCRLLLADPAVNPSALKGVALYGASDNGHAEVVKLLLADPRVDPAFENVGVRALTAARAKNHVTVRRLLEVDKRIIAAGLRAALNYQEDDSESDDEVIPATIGEGLNQNDYSSSDDATASYESGGWYDDEENQLQMALFQQFEQEHQQQNEEQPTLPIAVTTPQELEPIHPHLPPFNDDKYSFGS